MISRCGLMQKKDGMGMEEFKDYWLNVHGPIASKMANLRKYDQHVVVDAEHRHAIGQGSVVIDGYSELQFDSYGDMVSVAPTALLPSNSSKNGGTCTTAWCRPFPGA